MDKVDVSNLLSSKENQYRYANKDNYQSSCPQQPQSNQGSQNRTLQEVPQSRLNKNTHNTSANVLSSVDLSSQNRHEPYEFERPHKMRQYQSITESTAVLPPNQETNFMALWNNSVVESIDFKAELAGVDLKETGDALNCALYAEDVHKHCLKTEGEFKADPCYMKDQSDVNEKMRGILVDWLVEVHLKFKLLPETLYMTICSIDRYLSKKDVHRSKLQLVGVTSMLICTKYEEIYPPEVRDFVYITDKAYTEDDVLDMEVDILNTLEFNFTVPSILKFIDRYIKVLDLDRKTYMTAKYLSELCLLDLKYLKYAHSRLAAACVYLSVKINKQAEYNWNKDICRLSGLTEANIRETAKLLCGILKVYGCDKSALQAVRKKFLLEKYMKVARVEIQN